MIEINVNLRSPQVEQLLGEIMATLQETLEKVRQQGTRLDSLNTFVEGLYEAIRDRVNLTPEQQAVVDQIFTEVESNSGKIEEAFSENTPPA
jgi:ribosomal protein L16 Arg81 hydroxylase